MATFSRTPQTRALDRRARLQTMLDMPFGGAGLGGEIANAASQVGAGVLSTFGLGTVIREGSIPQGNTVPDARPGLIPNPIEPLGRLAQNIGGMIRGDKPQPSLSEDEYKSSPYFRSDIPFEQGMTEDRAAALATFYDQRKVSEYFAEKRPISAFLGQFVGQALDPINYVPVFGQAAEAAAVARLGTLGGRMLVSASDAAINTAAFGVMSAGLREEFGDDVSWQAMVNEIAMSALVGGVFGAGFGAVQLRREMAFTREDSNRAAAYRASDLAKIQDQLIDIRTVKEGRGIINEAVGSLATTGDVRLSPNSVAIADRISGEVTGRAAAVRSLDSVTINANEPVAITPSGQRVNVRPEVVDASTLVRATGDLQVRNRSSAASASQVEQIAVDLDPARLMPSVDADSGAPIVGSDNIIDSGNGRVMAIVRASQAYPAKYKAYRKALEDAGYDLTGIETPVLINRRTTELSREARALFNQEANAPRAAQMNPVELAAMDANALVDTLDILDASPVTSAANRAFVQRFMGNLSPSARGALVDGSGNINADGVRRIENALVASAYGDVDAAVLRRFAEATDDNTRAIVGAMADVAGRWAQMRQAIKRGDISPEFDMTPELTEALRRIGQWREQAKREARPVSVVIKEGMAQLDMLSGEISPEAQVMIGAFYQSNSFARAAGRETIADLLGRIVDATEELGRPQLFETADVGKLEMLRNATNDVETDLFAPVGAIDRAQEVGGLNRPVAATADSQGGGRAVEQDRAGIAAAEQPVPSIGSPVVLRDLPDVQQKAVQNAFLKTQPARTLDELYGVAGDHQDELGIIGAELGEKHGAEWRNPGIKKQATSAEKMARKRYDSTSRLTDVVRGGYVVKTPEQVDGIIADLAKTYPIVDEGWRMTSEAYFDRKVMVQFPDGTIGEVQFWHPDLLDAKDGRGHALYEEMRALPDGDPRYDELRYEQRQVYLEAIEKADDEWLPVVDQLLTELAGRPTSGNMASNASAVRGAPDSITSSTRTDSQAPPSDTIAQAELALTTAGRPSQSKNSTAVTPVVAKVGTSSLMVNDTVADAAARVGKPEDIRQMAAAHGVDPVTGEFVEMSDIAQIREEGRLSAEDEAELAAADEAFENSEAWGRALGAAVSCII